MYSQSTKGFVYFGSTIYSSIHSGAEYMRLSVVREDRSFLWPRAS